MKTTLPTLEQLNDESFVKELEYMRTLLTEADINEEAKPYRDGDVIGDTCDAPAGEVPYRLYAYLSTLFDDGVILDIGTLYGFDARSVAEINNKMEDDIKVILAEYRLALKKYSIR